MIWVGVGASAGLFLAGYWAITRSDVWYRASGGPGSGLAPSTRHLAGWALIAVGAIYAAVTVTLIVVSLR